MTKAKRLGQFFTPSDVARSLVLWAVRRSQDRVVDPSCGNGEFLSFHPRMVGVELDPEHAATARQRVPSATIHNEDFFAWADATGIRFDAAVGNPPFIRYQGFVGDARRRALQVATRIGAELPQLTSSWAPFIAGAVSLLRPGGRLAFVVPAEIGHATYAMPLLEALAERFETVRIIAIKDKMFPELSEDTWLLYADGFGGRSRFLELVIQDRFIPSPSPPAPEHEISLTGWRRARGHLRRWFLPRKALALYESLEDGPDAFRLGTVASVGIGYVTGANDFFHLRRSQVKALDIPATFLRRSVRKGEWLPETRVLTANHVRRWIADDEPAFLLDLAGRKVLPGAVRKYLESPAGAAARAAYKCRVRNPWFAVPDVHAPDGFLTYMSGERVGLVRNDARCVATNSVHVVNLKNGLSFFPLQRAWDHPLTTLSCEVEGHPLGGGMLKVEPREAQRILLPRHTMTLAPSSQALLNDGIRTMRRWRHYA